MFKTGKENVVSLQKAEIQKLKEELAYERTVRPMLQVFAQRLGNALLTQLAATKYSDWPQFAKDTFAWVANDAPTAAHMYKEALPK